MYGSPIVFMLVMVVGALWGLFTIIAVLDGSLTMLGISGAFGLAMVVAGWVAQALRLKRINKEMEELGQRKYR